jgi:hypothetical protein
MSGWEPPEKTYHCLRCHDSGKQQGLHCTDAHWCGNCAKRGSHPYDHTYCIPCPCKATNPVYQEYLAKLKADTATYRSKGRSHDAA